MSRSAGKTLLIFQHPHLRTLPVTSADNIRNICLHFTHWNIRTSADPDICILPPPLTKRVYNKFVYATNSFSPKVILVAFLT